MLVMNWFPGQIAKKGDLLGTIGFGDGSDEKKRKWVELLIQCVNNSVVLIATNFSII